MMLFFSPFHTIQSVDIMYVYSVPKRIFYGNFVKISKTWWKCYSTSKKTLNVKKWRRKTWKNKNDGEFPWIACNDGVMRIQLSLKVCCNVCRKQNQTSCERISNNRLQIPSGLNSNASLNGGCMSAFCAFMCIHVFFFFSSIRKSH